MRLRARRTLKCKVDKEEVDEWFGKLSERKEKEQGQSCVQCGSCRLFFTSLFLSVVSAQVVCIQS